MAAITPIDRMRIFLAPFLVLSVEFLPVRQAAIIHRFYDGHGLSVWILARRFFGISPVPADCHHRKQC
jgi:hypothetical protein